MFLSIKVSLICYFECRDLAARNCLVSSSNVVKIGGTVLCQFLNNSFLPLIYLPDFGMARDVQLEDYYRKCGRGRINFA